MAFLVLMVVLAICAQLRMSTGASQRTAINDMGLTRMDLAIESALLEAADQLRTDADSGAGDTGAGAGAGAAAGAAGAAGAAAGAAGGAGGSEQPVDSHEDAWGKPQRTEISRVEVRVMFQDEDSKVNVLGMLTADENEAEKVYQRVVRILDTCRQGTTEDIDSGDAERMAAVMRDHFRKRATSVSPRTKLLSDDEENIDLGLPLTLKELVVLEPFEPHHFRDYRDDHGEIVHGIGSFLTVHTALRTGDSMVTTNPLAPGAPSGGTAGAGAGTGGAGGGPQGGSPSTGGGSGSDSGGGQDPSGSGAGAQGQGSTPQGGSGAAGGAGGQSGGGAAASGSAAGIAINVNTAPPCVLKALMEERDIGGRFWDNVIEYRNLEEKKEEDAEQEDADPVYDEYGREVIKRQVFDTLQELEQVPGAERLPGDPKAEVMRLLGTQSQVFSIFITARIVTGRDTGRTQFDGPPPPGEREDELGNALTRTVRAIVWRVTSEDGTTIVPIVRWEVLDYLPFEVLDYPDEDR